MTKRPMSRVGDSNFSLQDIEERAKTAHSNGVNADRLLFSRSQTAAADRTPTFRLTRNTKGVASVSALWPQKRKELLPSMQRSASADLMSKRGYQLYTMSSFSNMCLRSVKNKQKIWQFMGRTDVQSHHLVKRQDILDLTECLHTAVAHVSEKSKHGNSGSAIDQDLMSFKSAAETLYATLNRYRQQQSKNQLFQQPITCKIETLAECEFRQKWADLVLGEIEGQLMVSFLEQGDLLALARVENAQAFDRIVQLHQDCLVELEQAVEQTICDKARLKELEAAHREADVRAQEKFQTAVEMVHEERQRDRLDCQRQTEAAQEEVERMNETLKTLNTIFKQMQEDTESVKGMELSSLNQVLESKCDMYKEELDLLRSLAPENEALKRSKADLKLQVEDLTSKLKENQEILQQKDVLIEDLLIKQARLLELEELMKVQQEQLLEQEKAVTPVAAIQPTTTICSRCKSSKRTGTFDTTSELTTEPKRRLACTAYRIMLPNLNGAKPLKSHMWTFSCMRAILHAKQLSDQVNVRHGRDKIRLPEFVYAWFSVSTEELVEMSLEEKENAMMQSDQHRWAFYYGIKLLAKEKVEAQVFYTLLDEKNGEDELVFALYCHRILCIHLSDMTDNYHLKTAASYEQLKQRTTIDELNVPETIACSLQEAADLSRIVLSKATHEEQAFFEQELKKKAKQGRVDVFHWLKLMLQEYREEQAHRRAAVRLMFQTATTGENPFMDMEQFTSLIMSLNMWCPPPMIATLYRNAYEIGSGSVSLESFTKAAESAQFYSSCLALPFQITKDSNQNRLGSIVHQQMAVCESNLIDLIETFPIQVQLTCRRVLGELTSVFLTGKGSSIDGSAAIHLFRQLLDECLQVQVIAEDRFSSTHQIETQLQSLLKFLVDTTQLQSLDKTRQHLAATRIQRAFRTRLSTDQGVPLSLRKHMHIGYGSGKTGFRERRALRPVFWIRNTVAELILIYCLEKPSIGLTEFIYQYYLTRLGSRWEGEKFVHDVFVNVRAHISKSSYRLVLFCQLCGIGDTPDDSFFATPQAIEFLSLALQYLYVPAEEIKSADTPYQFAFFMTEPFAEEDVKFISRKQAFKVIDALFSPVFPNEISDLHTEIQIMVVDSGNLAQDRIEADQFLFYLMNTWRKFLTHEIARFRVAICTDDTLLLGPVALESFQRVFESLGTNVSESCLHEAFLRATADAPDRVEAIVDASFPVFASSILRDRVGCLPIDATAQHQCNLAATFWETYSTAMQQEISFAKDEKDEVIREQIDILQRLLDEKTTDARQALFEFIKLRSLVRTVAQDDGPLPDTFRSE